MSEGSLGILEGQGRVKLELCRVPQASGSQPSASAQVPKWIGGMNLVDRATSIYHRKASEL